MHETWNSYGNQVLKAYISMIPVKKIFSLLGGKIKFELALQPSTLTQRLKFKLNFPAKESEDFLAGFKEK